MNTLKSAAVVLLVVLLAVMHAMAFDNQSGWPEGSEPSFCHAIDCPVFNVTYNNDTNQVQVREYAPGLWTSVNVSGTEFQTAVNDAFFLLFDYISGQNSAGSKIAMTAPVSVEIFPGQGPFCNTTFIVSFFVPFDYQTSSNPPPKPTNPQVYSNFIPARRLAIIQFGGFVKSFDTIVPEYTELSDWLTEEGYDFTPNLYTVSQYNSPYQIINRHNEIWIELPASN